MKLFEINFWLLSCFSGIWFHLFFDIILFTNFTILFLFFRDLKPENILLDSKVSKICYQSIVWSIKKYEIFETFYSWRSFMSTLCGNGSFMAEHWARHSGINAHLETATFNVCETLNHFMPYNECLFFSL